jgi:hypothetical protein
MLHAAATTGVYDYPFVNAHEATVIGTPSLYQAELPETVPVEEYTMAVFEDHAIPDVFWYSEGSNSSSCGRRSACP